MKDLLIIGAGPAGASAALFAAKAGKQVLVLDNDQSVTKRAWVENHYGVDGIEGPKLLEIGQKQAQKFGAEIIQGKAVKLEALEGGVRAHLENGDTYEAQYAIIASGLWVDVAEASGIAVKPGTEPRIKTVLDCDAQGRTSMARVWAAGTAAGVSMHTIITAGDGARVAIDIISELNGERYVDHDVLKS